MVRTVLLNSLNKYVSYCFLWDLLAWHDNRNSELSNHNNLPRSPWKITYMNSSLPWILFTF